MSGATGGASAPLRPRDHRGRFISAEREVLGSGHALQAKQLLTLIKDQRLVIEKNDRVFTLLVQRSMKNKPVSLYMKAKVYGGSCHDYYGVTCICRKDYCSCRGEALRKEARKALETLGKQVALSPENWYRDPKDPWEGEWTVESMGRLLIHLVHTNGHNIERLECGLKVSSDPGDL